MIAVLNNGGDMKSKETILVVDDEASIGNLIRLLLKKHGHTILTAKTPEEALEIAEKHAGSIQLLLTDMVMPRMDGKTLFTQIEKINPGIKALFMSGYTSNVIAHHNVIEEGVRFIAKPFNEDSLAQKVREILDSKE